MKEKTLGFQPVEHQQSFLYYCNFIWQLFHLIYQRNRKAPFWFVLQQFLQQLLFESEAFGIGDSDNELLPQDIFALVFR